MAKSRSGRSKKRRFTGNRYTIRATINENDETSELNSTESASAKKLESSHTSLEIFSERLFETSKDNRIVSWTTLISFFAIVCCPDCYSQGLELIEDSVSGLCSHMNLKCKNCSFFKGFPTTEKMKGSCLINSSIVLGLRIIGKGFSAGKKLCAFLGLPFLSKLAFRNQERKLLKATERVAQENINSALSEIQGSNSFTKCGISIDGTWQRRGYSSLNGCVSAISVDTGKILDIEVMTQYCHICAKGNSQSSKHVCSNYKGSAGNMEVVGAYRIFERSNVRNVQYNEYYGDGDSKGYESVKNFYGINTVTKLECIGHVQKRVGRRLRQLKKTTNGLGGKNKLTDKLIDRIQNYYGIAIRNNVGNLQKMMSSVIAAFFHCVSGKIISLHGQCPEGSESWCRYQRAKAAGSPLKEIEQGLPNKIINQIKPTYLKLCNETLLKKCLHGKTQNCNESYNNILWNIVPKNIFTGLETFRLGALLALILYNSGYAGILSVIRNVNGSLPESVAQELLKFDKQRISTSLRHSLPIAKLSRKKKKSS
ncbi:CCHC-type domain-containing protein [Trichonephila clavipes]|uniref:CCHC-type domain-containing protein n=1 Tax=Trichonephila clavipes TaxID=2585209 RepID=A0A8X6RXU5_TRICX|nr:CCHC-type domain-containing protein [Trichonephila clavipes]